MIEAGLADVLANGYWHGRSLAYSGGNLARLLEWCRMPGDLVFLVFGVAPVAIAAVRDCPGVSKVGRSAAHSIPS